MSSSQTPPPGQDSSAAIDSTCLSTVAGVAGACVAVGAATYYVMTRGENGRVKPATDLDKQSVQRPDGSRVSVLLGKDGELQHHLFDDARTAYESFRRGARVSGNGRCLGYRKEMPDGTAPYKWITYDDVIARAENLAAGFRSLDIDPGQETRIGIFSSNRPEWVITEQATYVYNMVNVPLYDTLGKEAVEFIMQQANITLCVCDNVKRADMLLSLASNCPNLKTIVMVEDISDDLRQKAENEAGVQLRHLADLEQDGATLKFKWPPTPPTPPDLCTICYTSGTTGTPKGAMITHGNMCANTTVYQQFVNVNLTPEDVMISYLPLAHMFERFLELLCYTLGCRVGFFRGDVKLLTEDLKELHPNVVPVVPRLLNRVYDKVMTDVGKSGLKRKLFDFALKSKQAELKRGIVRNNSIWDKLVFKRIREGMGGSCRLMITGSAPLADNVLSFIRAALGCFVVEGYGQTECAAACSVTLEGDNVPGHVGPPFPCCEIRLFDVPDMECYAKDNKGMRDADCLHEGQTLYHCGEICIRGLNVFRGYLNAPDKTAEALDADGWLHTGDIGRWTESGCIKIVDRKKHIFKLAQGEYIAPEKVENVLLSSRLIAQVYVYGDSLKSCIVAVVVPDEEGLPKYAVKQGIVDSQQSMAELCANPDIKAAILADMVAVSRKGGLNSLEVVKDIYLEPELWSVDNGLLTPTFKTKRPDLKKHYQKKIDDMYQHLQ